MLGTLCLSQPTVVSQGRRKTGVVVVGPALKRKALCPTRKCLNREDKVLGTFRLSQPTVVSQGRRKTGVVVVGPALKRKALCPTRKCLNREDKVLGTLRLSQPKGNSTKMYNMRQIFQQV